MFTTCIGRSLLITPPTAASYCTNASSSVMADNDDGSAIAGTSIRATLNASRSNPFHPRMHLVMVDGGSWRKGTVAIINCQLSLTMGSEIVGGETWRSDNMQSSLVMITSSQPP